MRPSAAKNIISTAPFLRGTDQQSILEHRYDHVGCSLHVKKCGIELHARPWHWGWRPVLGDHFLDKCVSVLCPLMLFTSEPSESLAVRVGVV